MIQNEISIILPVYNKEKYICKILQDIRKQTFKNYECIIVDDGSEDSSGRMCDEFSKLDFRFKVIHIKNNGVSNARNRGLMEATGKYITFIDADDRIDSNYLECLYNNATESDADMVISSYVKWWEGKDKHIEVVLPYRGLWKMTELLLDFAKIQKQTGIYGFCWGKLIKADKLHNMKFDENYVLAEDFEFYLRIYPMIDTIYFADKNYYCYLQQADNSSMVIADDEIDYLSQLYLNIRYREFLQKMNIYEKENKKIVDQLLSNYVFFTIFHSNRQYVKNNVDKMYHIVNSQQIILNGTDLMQKVILYFIKYNKGRMVKITLNVYDLLRKKLNRM